MKYRGHDISSIEFYRALIRTMAMKMQIQETPVAKRNRGSCIVKAGGKKARSGSSSWRKGSRKAQNV